MENDLDLDENKAFSKTMQLWLPLSFWDASPGLLLYFSSFSASYFIRPKQQTPDRKAFVIHQEFVAIGSTDNFRHDNTPVTVNTRWEDDLSNGFLERKTRSSPRRPPFLHAISFEWTKNL